MGANPTAQGAPSLARKSLFALSILMLVHLVFGVALLMLLIAPAFNRLERSVAEENLDRVNGMLRAEIEVLEQTNADWSHWDAMYRFAVGRNPNFEADHMTDNLAGTLGISWFFAQDNKGNTLATRSDQNLNAETVDTDLLLFDHEDEKRSGLLKIGPHLYLISSLPILDSTKIGTPAGSLTLAKRINDAFIEKIERRFAIEFDVINDIVATDIESTCPTNYRCDSRYLTDAFGDPVATIMVYTSRDLFRLGQDGLNLVLGLLAVSGVLYLVFTWILLRKLVLVRLERLASHIRAIANSGDLTRRLTGQGDDEIGAVAQDLNLMTDNLERADKRIRYLAYHDVVTGLSNRRSLNELLRGALAKPEEHQNLAVFFIDLDRFKIVNDTLSHAIGDKLLANVATRLRESTATHSSGEPGFLARVGGDEFIIVFFENLSVNQCCGIARSIIEKLEEPYFIDDEKLQISASIGISAYPKDSNTADSLIKQADIAMYRAKESGGGSYHVYNSALDAAYHERIQLDRELSLALERNQFELFYQPQVDFGAGRVVGCEALIRWRHPDLGLIPPNEFISMAEENGTISDIGRWAILEACRQIREWSDAGLGEFKIAVNVSPKQFRRGGLVSGIRNAMDLYGVPGQLLTVELTESSVMQHPEEVVKTLKRLKTMGLSISMDDFGTGYSSLSYLRRLPIDTIKIDRSFVVDMVHNHEDRALVSTIIALGKNLNRQVIAEGVESMEQVALLKNEGCNTMQGYFFGKPVPAKEFVQLLETPIPGLLQSPPSPKAVMI